MLQRRRCDLFVDSPEARRLWRCHGEVRHLLEISPDSPTGIVRDAAAHTSTEACRHRFPRQGLSVRRRCVDNPNAAYLARDGTTSARISRRIGGRPTRRACTSIASPPSADASEAASPGVMMKGPPACARQEPASSREEEPVGPRHRRTAGSSPEDGEFVPKHDDFQLLEIVRPKAPGSKLQNPPKHHVTEREEHRGLQRSQTVALFYAGI